MNAIMNKTNNGKRLIAAVAIFAMLACVFAVAMPFSGADAAAPTYADNAEIQRGDIVTENATVSFIDADGAEWDYVSGNTVPITNSSLGNTNMNIAVDVTDKTIVTISGNLMGQPEGAQYYLTGAPAGFEYGFVFNLADVVDDNGSYVFGDETNHVFIGYKNAEGEWKVLDKSGSTTTQLVYIDAERATGSTTYYFSDETIVEGETEGLKSFTVNYDFNLIPYGTYVDMIYRGDISTQNATVSFIDADGAEWDYVSGNTVPITNSSLGNYNMDMQRVNNTTVLITGTLANQANNSEFTATGAPAGFEYGFVFNLADVVDADGSYGFGTADDAMYIGYYNSEGEWKVIEKLGKTSTQLVYIDAERATGSTTYYFSDETIVEGETEGLKSFTVNYDFETTQTISSGDASQINEALENNDVVVIDGVTITSELTVPANTTLVFGDNVTLGDGAAIVLTASGATAQLGDLSDATFGLNNGTGGSTVSVENFSGVGVTVKYGSVTIDGKELSGTINVTDEVLNLSGTTEPTPGTDGSNALRINANGGTTVNIASDMTINGDGLKIQRADTKGAVTVNASDIILNGDIILESAVNMTAGELTGTGTIHVNAGAIFTYSSKTSGVTIDNSDGGIVKIEGAQGTENIISNDQNFEGDRYLSQDTVIEEGVTVTITANSTLNLMGFDLKVYGNLVIERNATITSMNANDAGTITLMSTGSIQNNNGIIGDTMPITIKNGENNETQTVSMQGVKGVNLKMDRDSDNRNLYNMSVSGDISRVTGTDVHRLSICNVDIDAAMTIGSNVEFYVTDNTTVAKNVVFTNNGAYMQIDGEFVLGNGASAVINAPTKGTITVQVGQIKSGDEFVFETLDESTVALDGVRDDSGTTVIYHGTTGITVSVGRITVPDEDDATKSNVFQQMYVSGTLDFTNNDRSTNAVEDGIIEFTGAVFIDGTLTAPEKNTIKFTDDGYFDVSEAGTIVLNDGNASIFDYYGAKYVVETTVENAPVETTYFTTFANAMAQIATVQDNLVTVSGSFEISGTYELTGEQAIEVEGDSEIVVAEDGQITVGVDATIDNDAFYTIEGRVIVTEGVGYRPSATVTGTSHYIYAVKTTVEDNTTTYSGFKVALDNATAGQTVTVVGNAEYDGNLVIPAQVTVDVNENIVLTVLGNVTVEAEGKLILDNNAQLVVGKDNARDYTITVNGDLDATEGGKIAKNEDNTGKVNMYSTGATSVVGNSITGVTINAAYYSDAGETVYTSVAKAIAYAEENALPSITATGTFSEGGAIESDDVNIVIALNSVVTLGDVTLTGAQISVAQPASGNTADKAGQYTATVSGLTGAGDAATTSTVSVNKTTATIASVDSLNAEGVTEYKITIDSVVNNTTVVAGTVEFAGVDDYEINTHKEQVLAVNSGATLLITGDVIISGDYIDNNGSIVIDEDAILSVGADGVTLTGDVAVGKDAQLLAGANPLVVTGTITVDAEGDFGVNGTLIVGAVPELLGDATTGSIIGEVVLGDEAVVYVFAGASVAETEFSNETSSEINATAYKINGIDFVTVYTFDSIDINSDVIDDFVDGLDDLYTPAPSNTEDFSATWYAEGSEVKDGETVGDYAEVTTEIQYNSISVTISVGSHISLSVDGVVYTSTSDKLLTIGTHTVSAVIDPGFSGNVTITFNGQAVTNGEITITSDMINSIEDIVISATGSLTQDSTVVIDGGNSGDSSMGLTDYLLIILVILIVVMAIIVALRLMRS